MKAETKGYGSGRDRIGVLSEDSPDADRGVFAEDPLSVMRPGTVVTAVADDEPRQGSKPRYDLGGDGT